MISFDAGGHRVQVRAAAVFIWQGLVLLHRLEGDHFWALPGGRVEPGEESAEAVVREMREELGEVVSCGALTYVVENFFDDERGRPHHEIGFYFQARFAADSTLLDAARSHFGIEGQRRLEFKWFRLAELDAMDVRPASLRGALGKPVAQLTHRVQRD